MPLLRGRLRASTFLRYRQGAGGGWSGKSKFRGHTGDLATRSARSKKVTIHFPNTRKQTRERCSQGNFQGFWPDKIFCCAGSDIRALLRDRNKRASRIWGLRAFEGLMSCLFSPCSLAVPKILSRILTHWHWAGTLQS